MLDKQCTLCLIRIVCNVSAWDLYNQSWLKKSAAILPFSLTLCDCTILRWNWLISSATRLLFRFVLVIYLLPTNTEHNYTNNDSQRTKLKNMKAKKSFDMHTTWRSLHVVTAQFIKGKQSEWQRIKWELDGKGKRDKSGRERKRTGRAENRNRKKLFDETQKLGKTQLF